MQQQTNQLKLKTIQELMISNLEERLKDIFEEKLEECLEENYSLVSEDWGDVYRDDDVEKAAKVIKEEMMDIINRF